MRIEHVALWTRDLERLRAFYEAHFGGRAGARYQNARGFSSYFLTFEGGARLELMSGPDMGPSGRGHIAFVVGEEPAAVDALTAALQAAGVPVIGQPRWTGDGYYESVVQDPDGHWVELTAAARRGA